MGGYCVKMAAETEYGSRAEEINGVKTWIKLCERLQLWGGEEEVKTLC